MNLFSQYCPTFSRGTLWLWNSPTFTTWGNYGVQSLRLLLVTPLILTRFDDTEIAAWYLFASLNFFGTTLSQRLGLTFSRMFAFAMGGASNLAPIQGKREQENGGQPNWGTFERAYGTVGSLNLGIGWLNILIALGMGWFGLTNLLDGYGAKGVIWLAFALMQGSALIVFIFQRYSIALLGMNYVALSNRWGIIFSLLSVGAGSLALILGGNIISLVLVMQFFSVAEVLRNRFLLRAVEEGRVLIFRQYCFDREVFSWAWEPTWKGFVGQLGLNGSVQLTAIVYTAYGTKQEVASLLFALRILQTITQIAQAPFSSVQPMMARLMAAGDLEKLGLLVRKRIGYSLALTALGIFTAGVFLPQFMGLIGASIQFLDFSAWFLLGSLALLFRFDVMNGAICGLGNNIVFYWDFLASAAAAFILIFCFKNSIGIYGPVVAVYLPAVLILNIRPIIRAKVALSVKGKVGWGADFLLIYGVFLLAIMLASFAS